MTSENFIKAAHICAPDSLARQAISRLDGIFGTTTEIVEDPSMLPDDIRKHIARHRYRAENVKGVFDTRDNRVYLIASRMEGDHDAIMTYRHEVNGHFGVRASLGDNRDQVFGEIYQSFESDPRLFEIANRYQLDLSYRENQLLVAEELIAMLAEPGEKASLYDQIQLDAKTEYSRQAGGQITYTDDDIKALLQRGKDYLRSRAAVPRGQALSPRAPSELEPRLSRINSIIKGFSQQQWNEFDAFLIRSPNVGTSTLISHYQSAEILAESVSKYLSEIGIDIDRDGSIRLREMGDKALSLIGDAATVLVESAAGDVQTVASNVTPGKPPTIIDHRAAHAVEAISPLRFMYLGEQAAEKLERADSFKIASQMKMEGRTALDIWMATGWFEGPDGAWRFELSDQDAVSSFEAMEETAWLQKELANVDRQLQGNLISPSEAARKSGFYRDRIDRINGDFETADPGTLPAFLSHPTLYEAYPELRTMRVIVDPDAPYPEVTTNTPGIILPESYLDDSDLLRETLLHETQHLVQRIEGFARGLSPFMNGYREQWEEELNQLLESDPDVQTYMKLHGDLFDGSLGVNPDLTKQEMNALEEDRQSIRRMNELTDRLRLIADPEAYTKAYGEIEANEAAARAGMTEAQRRKIAPYGINPKPSEFVVHRYDDIPQAMFMGVRARSANSGKLSQAYEMQNQGEDPEIILEQTGWFQGVDGSWRFEIDDAQTSLNQDALSILKPAWNTLESPRIGRLIHRPSKNGGFDLQMIPVDATRTSDIIELRGVSRSYMMMNLPGDVAAAVMESKGQPDYLDFENDDPDGLLLQTDFVYDAHNFMPLNRLVNHPALFEAYPELKQWSVAFHPKSEDFPKSSALCDSQRQTIVIFPQSERQIIPALLHETQHAIQVLEGFATGTSPGKPEVAAKIDNPGMEYHSSVRRAVEQAPFNKAGVVQWVGYLKKQPGVKQAELDWLGFESWAESPENEGNLSKENVLSYVGQQALKIHEVFIESQGKSQAQTLRTSLEKWCESFALAAADKGFGFEEPLELIHELRKRTSWKMDLGEDVPGASAVEGLPEIFAAVEGFTHQEFAEMIASISDLERNVERSYADVPEYESYIISGGHDYKEMLMVGSGDGLREKPGDDFSSDHFPGYYNIIAHSRFQTIEENGQKTLLVEEIQSDWRTRIQQTEGNLDAEGAMTQYEALLEEVNLTASKLNQAEDQLATSQNRLAEIGAMDAIRSYHEGDLNYADLSPEDQSLTDEYDRNVCQSINTVSEIEFLTSEYHRLDAARDRAKQGIENTPKDFPLGKDWYATVAKRLIRYAAENGFDSVAWSPSAVQADRYSAGNRQRYNEVEWHPAHIDGLIWVAAEREGDEVFCEELTAEQISSLFDSKTAAKILQKESGRIYDANITTDAKGFETFYNQMLPKAVDKAVKGYGQRTQWRPIEADHGLPGSTEFPTIQITDDMRRDLAGTTTPMYRYQTEDALSAYYRSAGEVEARAVEATYRDPELKSVFPMQRYDVAPEDQIVDREVSIALKLGAKAKGVRFGSLEAAAKIVSQKALGMQEAYPKVLNALAGNDHTTSANILRERFGRLASQLNGTLKENTGWTLDDTGHLRFEMSVPSLRAKKNIGQYIAQDVKKLAKGVREGVIDVTTLTDAYNQITQQNVPLRSLVGAHEVFTAYPELEDVMVRQEMGVRQQRFDSKSGVITVPNNLSSMELGAYLTKGVNQAINTFERIGDPKIQRALYPVSTLQKNRARAVESIVNQCQGMEQISKEVVEANLKHLEPTDAAFLTGLPLEKAARFAHAASLHLGGGWSNALPSYQAPEDPSAANELAHGFVTEKPTSELPGRNVAM